MHYHPSLASFCHVTEWEMSVVVRMDTGSEKTKTFMMLKMFL